MTPSGEVPVSVCTYRHVQDQEHWIILMESVERVLACLTFSQDVGQTILSVLLFRCNILRHCFSVNIAFHYIIIDLDFD